MLHIQSIVKFRKQGCTRNASDPQVTAQNRLHREFWAGHPNEKWLTDVTEFKWYEGPIIHKLYLSAILDLCDRRIVSYVIRDRNDNKLVFDTLDKAVLENPNAHPLFHSDRGFQYTSRTFHKKLLDAGMTQSMSRVGRCIDNGPMEGFWGILKRECYYHPIWRMNMIQSNNRSFKNKPLSNIQQAQFSIGWRFCPVCGNKLYKKIDGCSGTLQVKCSKCKETLRLDLAFRCR